MNTFIQWLLIGLGVGILISFTIIFLYSLIKNTNERRNVKRMMKKGQFLTPIDARDYDVKAWQNQKYGNIDSNKNAEELPQLNKKIFEKKNGSI